MYRIRFHGRGGQGMKTASRILGTAFFLEGYEVQDAPRYGAERRGAPIFAYVRAAREPIYERGVIRDPDLVVVADDSLVPIPAAGVLSGLDDHSLLLLDSLDSTETWKQRLNLPGPVLILPTPGETLERAERPLEGTACAAAAARLTGVVSRASLQQAISEELMPLGKETVEKNLDRALGTFELMTPHEGRVRPRVRPPTEQWAHPDWVDPGQEDTGKAAPVIHGGPTSDIQRTGLWRTLKPVIDYEHCNRCWWVCSTFCPDGAIKVEADGHPRIDYDHCKGCLICVAQCPPHAIGTVPEHHVAAGEET